ncbi:MAG: hypothetical protein FD135_2227 [Comamonadaceae bacterium]|nr:MAG: hypothetical protein FD135_2227 [Comamonadaceae bacterium]
MRINQVKTLAVIAAALGTLAALPAHAGKTLDGIKARGQVVCAVWLVLVQPTQLASGLAWMWTCAAPWLPPPWVMPKKSNTCP